MTRSLDLSHVHGAVLLPLTLRTERQILCSTLSKKVVGEKGGENQAPVFWIFFLVMTNVPPNEISLYYSLELKSKAHHSNAHLFCREHSACDGPRSESGKVNFFIWIR